MIHVKLRPMLAAASFLVALLLTGCMGDTERFIQGTWMYNEEHLMEMASERELFVHWFFSGGTFTYQACCFNMDMEFGGRYRILDASENELTIELYNTYGAGTRMDGEIRILIDWENETLDIQGTGPFRKLGP